MKFTCPCCGYKTLYEKPPGSDDICEICYWHDDYVQFKDSYFFGGANEPSLREAHKNFINFGAKEERVKPYVRRPKVSDIKDKEWTPIEYDQ